jgi:hypothetical protein
MTYGNGFHKFSKTCFTSFNNACPMKMSFTSFSNVWPMEMFFTSIPNNLIMHGIWNMFHKFEKDGGCFILLVSMYDRSFNWFIFISIPNGSYVCVSQVEKYIKHKNVSMIYHNFSYLNNLVVELP